MLWIYFTTPWSDAQVTWDAQAPATWADAGIEWQDALFPWEIVYPDYNSILNIRKAFKRFDFQRR